MGQNSFVFGLVFTEIFEFFQSSAQFDTAWSQSDFSVSFLKGQSKKILYLFFS